MGKCRKCGCTSFFWNPMSFGQKMMSGSNWDVSSPDQSVKGNVQFMKGQDNKSDQVAYRNCTCGHHYNYH